MTTNAYIRGVKTQSWESFPGKLWQRNYYERVIRDEQELNTIREYIQNNPAGWDQDVENVASLRINRLRFASTLLHGTKGKRCV